MGNNSKELIETAKEFLESYKQEIGKLAKTGSKSIPLSFQNLTSFSHELSESMLNQSTDTIRLLELALEETGLITNGHIEIIELPSSRKIRIKDIRAQNLRKISYLDVILQFKSEIYPNVLNRKFECPSCGSIISVQGASKPKRCSCGRKSDFNQLGKDVGDAIDITCRDVKEEGEKRVDSRKFSINRANITSKIDEFTEGSKIRLIGFPIIEEKIVSGIDKSEYSFEILNVELLEKAEEMEMTLIKNELNLRDFLFRYPDYIEPNLTRVAVERRFDNVSEYYQDSKSGRADLIFIDEFGSHLIIELKIEGHTKAIGQLKNYVMAYARENGIDEKNIRKMIGCLGASSTLERECKKGGVELKIFDKIKKTFKNDHLSDIPDSMKNFKLPSEASFVTEEKAFDIDKLSTGVTASQKNKILLVKEAVIRFESKVGKLIPIEELQKELGDKMDLGSLEEIIEKLCIAGDLFKPKRGFVQRM